MRPVTITVPRFEPRYAWANRVLRIDLGTKRVEAQPTAPYLPDLIGARGIAARICWDEYPEPVDAFAPANPLMVFGGALTGTRAPYSGRTTVRAFSPQGYPHPWFTRSIVGGYFGGELKRAGYDGLVVTGASAEPVRVQIRDDEVRILPAEELWGLDTADTLEMLQRIEGKDTRALVIGPAGERLSRIATIHAANATACGSGGSFLDAARRRGCQALVTGEATFHECLEAEAQQIALILPGHYASERFAVEQLATRLADSFPQCEVWASGAERDPLHWFQTERQP